MSFDFSRYRRCQTGLLILVIFGTLLLLVVPHAYEQDQPAKAARILYINQTGSWLDPSSGPDLYRDTFFSLYYLAAAVWHACIGGNVLYSMNLFSAVCGTAGIAFLCGWGRRFLQIPTWIMAMLLLSMPLVLISSIYGNEAIMAFMLLAASIYSATYSNRGAVITSGGLLALACFARPDAVLMVPFLCGVCVLSAHPVLDLKRDYRKMLSVSLWAGLGFCAAAAITWLLILRRLPVGETSFPLNFSPKVMAAYTVYPFCPSIVLLAGAGWLVLFRKARARALLLLLLLIPLGFYFKNLSTPKYILPFAVGYAVAAGVLITAIPIWARSLSFLSIAFWWCVSLSPFGIHSGNRGAYWYLPTDDGPIPTGSYFSFYQNIRTGFFQERYNSEINSIRAASRHYSGSPNLQGYFNHQSGALVSIENGNYEVKKLASASLEGFSEKTDTPYVMILTSYLRTDPLRPADLEQFRKWLGEGRLKAPIQSNEPFPPFIETGPLIPAGTDHELGKRILFALDHSLGRGYQPRSVFVKDYTATSWVRTDSQPNLQGYVYADSQFTAFPNSTENGVVYSMVMPMRYYQEKDPRPQINSKK